MMDDRAVVVAVKKRKAVILVSGGIFEEIQNQGYAVGEKIIRKNLRSHHASHMLRRGLMIAACFVLLLASSTMAIAKYVPWVSVTVAYGEATVQYQLNALNEVLSASSDTEEGQAILESVSPAPYEPIGSVIENSLSAMQNSQGSEAGLYVEIAPRFGDGRSAEEAITESVGIYHMDMTLERVPWNESGQPHGQLEHDRPENNPSVHMDEPSTPAESEQAMPSEGQFPPANSGQQPPVEGQSEHENDEQPHAMNGQPVSGDSEQDVLMEEQTLYTASRQNPLWEEPSASAGNNQNQPMEEHPLPYTGNEEYVTPFPDAEQIQLEMNPMEEDNKRGASNLTQNENEPGKPLMPFYAMNQDKLEEAIPQQDITTEQGHNEMERNGISENMHVAPDEAKGADLSPTTDLKKPSEDVKREKP